MKFVFNTAKSVIFYGLVASGIVIGINTGKCIYHEIVEPKLNNLCRGDVEPIPNEDKFIEE